MFLGPGAHFDGSVKRQLLGNRFTVVVVVVGGSHLAGVSSAAQLRVLRERTFKALLRRHSNRNQCDHHDQCEEKCEERTREREVADLHWRFGHLRPSRWRTYFSP